MKPNPRSIFNGTGPRRRGELVPPRNLRELILAAWRAGLPWLLAFASIGLFAWTEVQIQHWYQGLPATLLQILSLAVELAALWQINWLL